MHSIIRQSIPLLTHASDQEIQRCWVQYCQAAFGDEMPFESAMLHDFHAYTLAAQAQTVENWDEIREIWWKRVPETGGTRVEAIESINSKNGGG